MIGLTAVTAVSRHLSTLISVLINTQISQIILLKEVRHRYRRDNFTQFYCYSVDSAFELYRLIKIIISISKPILQTRVTFEQHSSKMTNNIKSKPEFIQDNIIMIEDELKNMQDNEVILSDFKNKLNQFVR